MHRALVLVAVVVTACAAPVAESEKEAQAREAELSLVKHKVEELVPFTTDGCSMFPDGTPANRTLWQQCCIVHDFAYYVGGTREERARADEALGACVAGVTSRTLGNLMWSGVRLGGSPAFPTPWRWGYGWKYDLVNGYRTLPADQLAAAQAEVERYRADPVAPDAFEQRFWALVDSAGQVEGLSFASRQVEEEAQRFVESSCASIACEPGSVCDPEAGACVAQTVAMICQDTCEWSFDGECDDGGAGSAYSVCEYGSDCGDCGDR